MQRFSTELFETPPVPCTMLVHDEELLGKGTVWGFYPHRCHVETDLRTSPGMSVSLWLHFPGTPRVKLPTGLVTWSCGSECGVQFTRGFP
jgi:hypothetical protein